MVTSSPLASAHQPTEYGCELPQSKERSIRQLSGTLKRGTICTDVCHTSSSAPPATMSQSPSSQALRLFGSDSASSKAIYSGARYLFSRYEPKRCVCVRVTGSFWLVRGL